MTSPLETKARALAEQIASEAVEQVEEGVEVFDRFSVPKALPFLLAFASEVERETLERIVRHFEARREKARGSLAGAWLGEIVAELRSLSEPPAETPEPKG